MTSSTTQPGVLLAGRYRKVQVLGAGGQGEVWLAIDVQTGKRVALKQRPGRETLDAKTRELFWR